MQKLAILILLSVIVGCWTNETDKLNENRGETITNSFPSRPVQIISEEGFGADLKLSFTESYTTDTSTVYRVNSTYQNKNLGFIINVPSARLAKLSIRRDGENSDNFIRLLQKLYKQKIDTTTKFVSYIQGDCISMARYFDSLNKQSNSNYTIAAENKIFLQGKNEEDYAELFLNVDESEHWIELKEKDEEYRPIIIKLLTQK